MSPSQIPLGIYTHINYAFLYVDPNTFRVAPMDSIVGSLYGQVTALKARDPGLQVWVTVGGWSFTDPGPTATTFSQLVASSDAQSEFFASILLLLM